MNTYERPFYEKGWCIVLAFLLCWPVGAVLLGLRILKDRELREAASEAYERYAPDGQKKVELKRTCRVRKIWGWVLIVIGGCILIGITDTIGFMDFLGSLVTGVGILLAGVILLLTAKTQVEKWDRYEAWINNRGNTPIAFLAEKTGYSDKEVRTDIQGMINSGFFRDDSQGLNAYINGEWDLLVMTRNGNPIEPVVKPAYRKTSSQKEEKGYLEKLHDEIKRAADEEILPVLCDMEGAVKRIEDRLAEEPDLKDMTSVKKLYESYLPQTMELIRKYNENDVTDATKWEIRAMLATCTQAFRNIEGKLYERNDTATKVDIEVLKKTLEREGLLDSDFDIGKGEK